jgi:hypothetical protein
MTTEKPEVSSQTETEKSGDSNSQKPYGGLGRDCQVILNRRSLPLFTMKATSLNETGFCYYSN